LIRSLTNIEAIDGGEGYNKIQLRYSSTDILDASNITLTNIDELSGHGDHSTIIGSAGDDFIVGGTGDDNLKGGTGNDTFSVTGTTNGSDHFDGGEGHDTILGSADNDVIGIRSLTGIEAIDGGDGYDKLIMRYSSVDVLDVSNVALTGIEELNGHGDHITIIGTAGDDYIVGGAGDDNLQGGGGDDTFSVTGTTHGTDHFNGGEGHDVIVGSAGNDTIGIRSLTGIEAIDGGDGYDILTMRYSSFNVLDMSNVALTGIEELNGDGDHITIIGTAGDDRINGGNGNDTLTGGEGSDTYLFDLGDDSDTIRNHSATFATDTDKLELSGTSHDQLWFSQAGNDLTIDYTGSNDQIRVDDWYLGDAYELDEVHASGQVLLANQVDQLVAAMASFSAGEPSSLNDLTTQQLSDLNGAIAVAWQAT
jgi:Ca2+-binding RTX toxin-like protein